MKKTYILVTGCAGFVGMHLSKKLLEKNYFVYGLDDLNPYYSQKLKIDRLKILKKYKNFKFSKLNICKKNTLFKKLKNKHFSHVFHFAAQAGVRYSLKNPDSYINNNIIGFVNLLEYFKNKNLKNFFFASSSSVYGRNKKIPYSENFNTDYPKSLYAATKKSGEILAEYYNYYFKMNIIGLRFFTIYGPWGRPDMSLFLFTDLLKKNKKINIFNKGKMSRSFTYIDDIIESIFKLFMTQKNLDYKTVQIFNIGGDKKIGLNKFIKILEREIGRKFKKSYKPMMKADVQNTFSNNKKLFKFIKFEPKTSISLGVKNFIKWHQKYYN